MREQCLCVHCNFLSDFSFHHTHNAHTHGKQTKQFSFITNRLNEPSADQGKKTERKRVAKLVFGLHNYAGFDFFHSFSQFLQSCRNCACLIEMIVFC